MGTDILRALMEPNPYLPPAAASAPAEVSQSSDELIRRQCINRESTIRTLGALYILGGILGLIGSASLLASSSPASDGASQATLGALYLGISVVGLVGGLGLRRLKPWARILGTVQACLGLLAFPVGTLINALILSAFWTNPSKTIFSEDYKRIIAATPQVKVKTSKVTVVILVVLLVVIISIIGAVILSSRR